MIVLKEKRSVQWPIQKMKQGYGTPDYLLISNFIRLHKKAIIHAVR